MIQDMDESTCEGAGPGADIEEVVWLWMDSVRDTRLG